MIENKNVLAVYQQLENRYPQQSQFLETVREIFESLSVIYDKHPEYVERKIAEKLSQPDMLHCFRVDWTSDDGKQQSNIGYRVQFNNAVGVYKGGLRFNSNVNESILKSLAMEQTLKNAITSLPMGGAKGGSDFDPHNKSDKEIERFCSAFMKQLYPYIGADRDVPAGDLGVGSKEIQYLLKEYLKHKSDIGAITGKPVDKGGLLGRKEATGYGLIYFAQALLKQHNMTFENKEVIVSGTGNVATYTNKKATELHATVIGMSDSHGYIYNEKGIDYKIVEKVKSNNRASIKGYLDYDPTTIYKEDPSGLFELKCDYCFPCATQNEINLSIAKTLVSNGCKLVCEGANLPSTLDAIDYFINNGVLFGPAKASNAGGVSCSYFEMCQNRDNVKWTFEQTDKKLKTTMTNIYKNISKKAKEYGQPNNLLLGANIFGLEKVIKKMK